MKLVVVGKGGREHALASRLLQSDLVDELWVCPGNEGMRLSGISCSPEESPEAIEKFCLANKISLVVVGPEASILSDLKHRLESQGIACFSPTPEGGQLEASKLYCKSILLEAGIPTAACIQAHHPEQVLEAIQDHDFTNPLVLKADGLAQGKGVWVCETQAQALAGAEALRQQFGFPLLIEECLIGQELSAFALCDGKDFVLLGTACDYKRITEDPFSANTGGMGAYSPCDFITPDDEAKIHEIFSKTLKCLADKNIPYQGFLFAGLMKTSRGLFVLEFNVRMGDPETQALMPRIESDLARLIMAAVSHELKNQSCQLSPCHSVHVVAVSEGYPQAQMQLGGIIDYPSSLASGAQLFFSGVKKQGSHLVNSGGRVLGVTAIANSREEARQIAYSEIHKVSFPGMYLRKDIAR